MPGQTLLVQGASGGMSTALIQMGRAAGFEVWVTTRNGEGAAIKRGGVLVINGITTGHAAENIVSRRGNLPIYSVTPTQLFEATSTI